MATQVPCIKNGAAGFTFGIGLIDQSNTKLLKASPTLATGDFKISIDGGAFANLATLPTVTPAAGRQVQIVLSQGETNGDNLFIQCVDAAGAEWCDAWINVQTTARHLDDLAFPATSGRSMVVDANGLVDANAVKVGPTGSGTAQTTGDIFARLGAPAGASMSADTAAVKADTAAVKTQTDKLTFTVANQIDANVLDWKSATAPAMTGDAFARLGAPAGASVSADVAAVKAVLPSALVGGRMDSSIGAVANGAIAAAAFAAGALDAVWSTATRLLTAGTNIVLAKGTGVTGFNDLDAAGVRTAVGLASANFDTQLSGINTKTTNLPAAPAAVSDIPTAVANADALLGRNIAGGSSTGRIVTDALRFLRNKWSVSAGTLTVCQEDDTTTAWTGTVSTDAAALPITGNDPS